MNVHKVERPNSENVFFILIIIHYSTVVRSQNFILVVRIYFKYDITLVMPDGFGRGMYNCIQQISLLISMYNLKMGLPRWSSGRKHDC